MYQTSCPRGYDYSTGARKRRVPDINLDMQVPAATPTIVLEHLERVDENPLSHEERVRWQARAVRQIKSC
jgi:hypothetical protein